MDNKITAFYVPRLLVVAALLVSASNQFNPSRMVEALLWGSCLFFSFRQD